MRERGVRADLDAPATAASAEVLLCWSVAAAPARWLPRLDALAAECLAPDALAARRWLRLAPRYLGRKAQNMRVLRCGEEEAARFIAAVREQSAAGGIGISVEIRMDAPGGRQIFSFQPEHQS